MDENNPYQSFPKKQNALDSGPSKIPTFKKLILYIVGGFLLFSGSIFLLLELNDLFQKNQISEAGLAFAIIANLFLSGFYMLYLGYSKHRHVIPALLGIFSLNFVLLGLGDILDNIVGPGTPDWNGVFILVLFFTVVGLGFILFANRKNRKK